MAAVSGPWVQGAIRVGELFGLVTPVHVRHVYAANLLSVGLVDQAGNFTGDDVVLRIPVAANSVQRPGDPPLLALRLYDDAAADGHTADALGPCPDARRFTERLLRSAVRVVAHVPIPERRWWLESLVPGVQCTGDLYVQTDTDPPDDGWRIGGRRLSHLLIEAGHADVMDTGDEYAA